MLSLAHLALLRAGTADADAELRRRGILRGKASRQKLGDYCEVLVARHVDGHLAPVNNPGFDVESETLGRIEVKARSLSAKHLNWYHLRGPDRQLLDHLVAVGLRGDWTVAAAWLLTFDEVLAVRHRRRDGRDVEPTKLAIRGSWKARARQIDLAATQAALA